MNIFLKRYYDMLYPESLKENEYVCLFVVKTDEEGNPVCDADGNEITFHRFVKTLSSMRSV